MRYFLSLIASLRSFRPSRIVARRLSVILILWVALVWLAQPRAWAAPGESGAGQTIPSVTPGVAGTPVGVPDGLAPLNSSTSTTSLALLLSVFPLGCVFFVLAMFLILFGLFLWLRRRSGSRKELRNASQAR